MFDMFKEKKYARCDRCGKFCKIKALKHLTILVKDCKIGECITLSGRNRQMMLHEGCAKEEIKRCVLSDSEKAMIDCDDKTLIDFAKDCYRDLERVREQMKYTRDEYIVDNRGNAYVKQV